MKALLSMIVLAGLMVQPVRAEDAQTEAAPTAGAEATPAKPKIAVIAPEQIDGEWFWFSWGGGQQHIVQSAIEKALVRAGFEVIDVTALGSWRSLDDLVGTHSAASKGKELGADYVIAGKATAVRASEGQAYGVNVVRANAEVSIRIVRVSDGKVIGVEDASTQAGGQAVRSAGQDALKKAGQEIGRKIVNALRAATAE